MTDRMFVVVHHTHVDAAVALQRIHERGNRAIAISLNGFFRAVFTNGGVHHTHLIGSAIRLLTVLHNLVRLVRFEILGFERIAHVLGQNLFTRLVRDHLNGFAELNLQWPRQIQVVFVFNVRDAAFARLTVDANDGL